ncbi:hypothetical protein INS49_014573 [Diaporthe citri]|uniref:uncharacterized protein n=1 Tax=Diaporthe citri TaxID=83186 RepID=UPI001C819521|nr:uncharacterized protein INS49_014573 [Diaporthe citri]KAG6356699.1 hypothetical protein INS49_014573 [Diaporthe citri]
MPEVIHVAIVGATGTMGSSIVPCLLGSKDPVFEVTALVRPDSSKAAEAAKLQGVHHIVAVDLIGPQDDLVSSVEGIDCVMCILPPHCTMQQIPLADAALKAKVKRFVPNMWSTPCPPKGVMKIREWKEDAVNHPKKIHMPYTVVDIGYWHEIMIPRIESGKLDHRALYPTFFFVDEGSAPCATTYLPDVGRYVARIIADPRTLNRMVFAYGEVTTQRAALDTVERLSREKCPFKAVTYEQVAATVRSGGLDLWSQVILEYVYSSWARGDNDPRWAEFLGYLDAKSLYPDLEAHTLEQSIRDALAHPEPIDRICVGTKETAGA